MRLSPISLKDANEFVRLHHRHHRPVVGHKFSLAVVVDDEVVGVAIVGRPVSRHRDDGTTLEVTRLCTNGYKNACSFLYSKAAKAAWALGYTRIGTYILESEPGTSLKAANWTCIGKRGGGEWHAPSRPRIKGLYPTEPKTLFEAYPKS